jgi:FtsH-binding integral membrane protein
MAHQMVKPYSWLLYLLAVLASFFAGLSYAGFIDAGKDQGLAAAAIVLGYGVIGAAIGLVGALFVAYQARRRTVFRLNIILVLCIAAFAGYFYMMYLERQKAKAESQYEIEQGVD